MKLVITQRRRNKAGEDYRQLFDELKRLNEMIKKSGTQVFLVGGVGAGLLRGSFEKNPHDIDLAIFSEDFENFCDYMKKEGYTLIKKISNGHISPFHDYNIVIEVKPSQVLKNEMKNLRLMSKGDIRFFYAKSRLDFLDLFLWERDGGEKIYVRGERIRFPSEMLLPIKRYSEGKIDDGLYETNAASGTNGALLIPNSKHRDYVLHLKNLKRLNLASSAEVEFGRVYPV